MQLDMHYYGTFALARAAGLKPDAARIIATCAQFVDDNVAGTTLKFKSGARVDSVATAHHAFDKENLSLEDQRRVWVPFHFLPGNIGGTFTERLKCRMNSDIAQQMVDHHLSLAAKPYSLELLGIAAHVYADTFAHYGFSGISSRGNRVDNESFRFRELNPEIEKYILDKEANFKNTKGAKLQPNFRDDVRREDGWSDGGLWASVKNTVTSWFAENASGALGHGSVVTFPDRPYLVWEYNYERDDAELADKDPDNPKHSTRNNPETYLVGCELIHTMFDRFRQGKNTLDNGDFRPFGEIREPVLDTLRVQADKEGRISAWKNVAATGRIFGNGGETIPDYGGNSWNDEWANADGSEDSSVIRDEPIWHFYQAASIHRTYVLRELLPNHELIVD